MRDLQTTPPNAAEWKAPKSESREDRERALFQQGWDRFYPPTEDEEGRAITTDIRSTYNKNNGVITAVNSEGAKFVAPFSPDLEKNLRDVGFGLNEKMNVPYSNQGPDHPEAKARWAKLWENHNRENTKPVN